MPPEAGVLDSVSSVSAMLAFFVRWLRTWRGVESEEGGRGKRELWMRDPRVTKNPKIFLVIFRFTWAFSLLSTVWDGA
jgi:hypothetical protein